MKAVFYAGNSRIELREVPIPTPGLGDVLIRIRASVICGSELHDYHSEHGGKGIAGHEGVGEVVSAPATSGLAEGQLVAVQVLSGCGNCERCLAGDPEHCTKMRFHGGTHAEFMAVPAMCCRPVPADIPPDIAVLLGGDAIGTPYHALSRLGIERGRHRGGLRLRADRAGVHRRAALLRRAYPGRRAGRVSSRVGVHARRGDRPRSHCGGRGGTCPRSDRRSWRKRDARLFAGS